MSRRVREEFTVRMGKGTHDESGGGEEELKLHGGYWEESILSGPF